MRLTHLALFAVALLIMAQAFPTLAAEPAKTVELKEALAVPYAAPEFAGITQWLNSDPLTLAKLKGKVVLVDFWAYSCVNCVRTLPYLTRWDTQYRDQGLVIIGVHAPEFAFEKEPKNVQAALTKRSIHYPIALDNNLATWTAYHNQYWPAHYLIDREGRVVYTHFGEGKYDVTEQNIRNLLGITAPMAAPKTDDKPFAAGQTPETYLGFARADHYAGSPALTTAPAASFALPTALTADQWALQGQWNVAAQTITAQEKGATLRLNFTARKVYLVLGTRDGKAHKLSLALNGKPVGDNAGADAKDGVVNVTQHTIYELVDQHKAGPGQLTITTEDAGVEAYAFTFGS